MLTHEGVEKKRIQDSVSGPSAFARPLWVFAKDRKD